MVSAIIVAAGKGVRMGSNVDKLFLELNGSPVIAHTWRTFEEARPIDELRIVVRKEMQSLFEAVAKKYKFNKPFRLITGGAERQDSVWNGLQAISAESEIVVIQDAARPCTSAELIAATIDAARETGAAVAAQALTDTIKESDDGQFITRTLDRSKLWAVQTPQTFRTKIIRRALEEVRKRNLVVTDDTAACELIGQAVKMVVCTGPNPKITRQEDISFVETLLRARRQG